MSIPWLSILLPTYNGEKYLASTLNSVLMQNDFDIECLAVDDGSSDGTEQMVRERIEMDHPLRRWKFYPRFATKFPCAFTGPPAAGIG